jgi:phosphopentomutase
MRTEIVHRFVNSDGMISNMKFLKQDRKGKYAFYIKDTIFVIKLNLETKSTVLIGQTSDAVLAMNVTNNQIREKDLELVTRNQRDLENSNDEEGFMLVALDESQNIYVFDGFGGKVK